MKTLAFLAIPLTLAACTSPMEITQPPVTAEVSQTIPRERLSNLTAMTVRSHVEADGGSAEVGGLPCFAQSDDLYAEFTTPAIVQVPRFVQSGRFDNRGRPTTLLISCEGGGYSGATSLTAQDKELSTVTNAGLAGALISTAVSAAIASSTPWRFPDEVSVPVTK